MNAFVTTTIPNVQAFNTSFESTMILIFIRTNSHTAVCLQNRRPGVVGNCGSSSYIESIDSVWKGFHLSRVFTLDKE